MGNMQQLGKDVASSAKKKVEAQSENYQLNNSNTEQNLSGSKVEEIAYNALDHHITYQKTQYSYNEKLNEYKEAAFNDYEKQQPHLLEESSNPPQEQSPPPVPPSEPSDELTPPSVSSMSSLPGGGVSNVTERYSGIKLGTSENGTLATNSVILSKNVELIEKLDDKRGYAQRKYTRLTLNAGGKEISTKARLNFNYYGRIIRLSEQKTDLLNVGRVKYESQIVREKMTRKDYTDWMQEKEKKAFKRRVKGRLLFNKGRSLVNDDSIAEDENAAMLKRGAVRAARASAMSVRKNVKILRLQNNVYARLELANKRHQVLLNKRERLLSRDERKSQMDKALSAKQKHELKKKMARHHAEKEGSFFRRIKQQFMVKKAGREYRRQAVKRTLKTVFAAAGIISFIVLLLGILLLLFLAVTQGGATYYGAAVTQNDYDTITEATAYFRKLETDLDEYLNADREALEAELEAEYGPDIYEYIYNLADFGFSANTLIAYLSAVYVEFTLEDIAEELQAIFDEMYTLTIEVKIEDRDVLKYNPDKGEYYTVTEPKKICYVTLEKKELEEVVEARLSGDQKEQYNGYKLSTGGQQVYAPVMREDWTNLISSNYGERIHPITKVRTFHKGVDIAVPEGTKLYSAVKGIVTVSQYSESAGNYVTVKTESGWTVTFMHMNSRSVTVGQTIEQGDFVGLSGNTGNSTGPHLHLQVANDAGETVNPIFIIPQTCAFIKGDVQQEVQ